MRAPLGDTPPGGVVESRMDAILSESAVAKYLHPKGLLVNIWKQML
jgi:hypothetical protein